MKLSRIPNRSLVTSWQWSFNVDSSTGAPYSNPGHSMLNAIATRPWLRPLMAQAARQPAPALRTLPARWLAGAWSWPASSVAVGQLRGMKVRTSVKKLCDGCKVSLVARYEGCL